MSKKQFFWTKTFFASIPLLLLILRSIYFDVLNTRIDTTFIILMSATAIIAILPWDRLSTFKVGGVEISLDKPEIVAGLKGLNLISDEQLKNKLLRLSSETEQIQGGRILWIDDRPHQVLSERRLLRALGIETIMAISSDEAEKKLQEDNDFDLVITDVVREAEGVKLHDSGQVPAGVDFIMKLRHNKDDAIQSLPVIFYSSYDSREALARDTRPARDLEPEAELSHEPGTLLIKAIKSIAERRQQPIKSKDRK